MSQSEIERLIGDLSTDGALRDRLASVGNDFDAALAAVCDAGYGIEADEARAYLAALSAGTRQELEDKDLDAVTGGEAAPEIGCNNYMGIPGVGKRKFDMYVPKDYLR